MIGTFYITRTGQSTKYTDGLINGSGFALVVETAQDGSQKIGIEADFIRTRANADMNEQLPGANGIQGFTFIAATIQLKGLQKIEIAPSI